MATDDGEKWAIMAASGGRSRRPEGERERKRQRKRQKDRMCPNERLIGLWLRRHIPAISSLGMEEDILGSTHSFKKNLSTYHPDFDFVD